MSRWYTARRLYLLLGLAPLVLIAPVLLRGKALFWGTPSLQFVPWREFAWSLLRQAELPLWNPFSGMGAPLFANYQVALAYPFTWLLFLLSSLGGVEWHAWGQALLVLIHWIIAAAGMFYLARDLRLGVFAQVVAGLAYSLGGYLVTRAGFLSINAATAWLPWILLFAGRLASDSFRGDETRSRVWIKLLLAAALQLLSGHAQTAWYTCLLAFLWAGFWAARGAPLASGLTSGWQFLRRRTAPVLQCWGRLAAAYLCAAALAAVQLIPTAEYLLQSPRAAAVDFDYALTYSYWPWRLITLLAPDLFGSPVQGDYWGYANYWEDALYIGLLPLLLALTAGVGWLTGGRRAKNQPLQVESSGNGSILKKQAIPALFLIIVLSFLLAFGKNTPLFPWLYRHIPTFDMFQAPTRFTLWAAFALALLAGIGADAWRRPRKRALYWTRLGTAGAVAVTIGAGLAWYFLGAVSPTFIRATALAGLWGVGAGALSLLAPPADQDKPFPLWQWAAALFIAADLVAAGWGMNPGIDPYFYSREPETAGPVRAMLAGRRLYLPRGIEQSLKFDRFLRFDTYQSGEVWMDLRDTLLPNINMLDRIASTNNFDPLVPARFNPWMETLAQSGASTSGRLFDLSGVGAIENLDLLRTTGVSFQALPENTGRRVRWVGCGRIVAGENAALEAVRSLSFDPDGEVILEGTPADLASNCIPGGAPGLVQILEDSPGRIVLDVQAERPGWLLLSDTWYPGWKATVDGENRPVYRADYLFRGVALDAGQQRVVFEYHPVSFTVGLLLSLATLAGTICFLLVIRSRRA